MGFPVRSCAAGEHGGFQCPVGPFGHTISGGVVGGGVVYRGSHQLTKG